MNTIYIVVYTKYTESKFSYLVLLMEKIVTDNSEENFNHFDENKFFKLKTNRRDKYVDCPYCGTVLRNVSQICKNCNSIIEIQKPSVLQDLKNYLTNYFIVDIKKIFTSKFVKFFLIFNLNVFLIVGFANSLFRPYPVAKFFLSNASAVNTLYIFPLSKVLGWDNILAKPFYPVRELLYQTGLFFLPKEEGERESWWFAIRFKEYDELVRPLIFKLHTTRATFWDYKKIIKILKFNDEVYEHTLKLATLKIKDKHLRSRRYNQLVVAMYKYNLCAVGSKTRELFKIKKEKDGNAFFIKGNLIDKFETLLNLFIRQTDYIKKEEPDAYKYFKNETDHFYLDEIVIFNYSRYIVQSDLVEKKVIDYNNRNSSVPIFNRSKFDETYCNSRYFCIMTNSISKIKPYLENKFLPENVRIYIKNDSINNMPQEEDEMYSKCTNYESKQLIQYPNKKKGV